MSKKQPPSPRSTRATTSKIVLTGEPKPGTTKTGGMDPFATVQDSLSAAMMEMRKVSSLAEDLHLEISEVKKAQADTDLSVAENIQRLNEAEGRFFELENENTHLKQQMVMNNKSHEDLLKQMQDLMNGGRRLNIRLVGLKEKQEMTNPREKGRQIMD